MVDTVKSGDRLAEWMLKNLDDTEINRFITMRERTHVLSVLAPEAVHYKKKGKYAEEEKKPVVTEEIVEEAHREVVENIVEEEKAKQTEEDPDKAKKHALEQSLREQLGGLFGGLLGKKKQEANKIEDIPPPKPPLSIMLTAEGTAQKDYQIISDDPSKTKITKTECVNGLYGGGFQRITATIDGIGPEEENTQKYEVGYATAYGATGGRALQQEKDVFLSVSDQPKKLGPWKYERNMILTFGKDVPREESYFQVLDEMLKQRCEKIEVVINAVVADKRQELNFLIYRPEDIDHKIITAEPVILSVEYPAEYERGLAQMEDALNENQLFRFKVIKPASVKLHPTVIITANRIDGQPLNCNSHNQFFKAAAEEDGEHIIVSFMAKNAVDAGYSSAFDYIEKHQQVKELVTLNVRLVLTKADSAVPLAEATVLVHRKADEGEWHEVQGETREEVVDDELTEDEKATFDPQQREMMRLLRKVWPKYLAYLKESWNAPAGSPLFTVDGLIVSGLDYEGRDNTYVEKEGRSNFIPLILVHLPDTAWGIALPDPRGLHAENLGEFYSGLDRDSWFTLKMYSHKASGKHDDVVHFRHVCVVEQREGTWHVLAKGQIEAKNDYSPGPANLLQGVLDSFKKSFRRK